MTDNIVRSIRFNFMLGVFVLFQRNFSFKAAVANITLNLGFLYNVWPKSLAFIAILLDGFFNLILFCIN